MTYDVFGGTLNIAQSNLLTAFTQCSVVPPQIAIGASILHTRYGLSVNLVTNYM